MEITIREKMVEQVRVDLTCGRGEIGRVPYTTQQVEAFLSTNKNGIDTAVHEMIQRYTMTGIWMTSKTLNPTGLWNFCTTTLNFLLESYKNCVCLTNTIF